MPSASSRNFSVRLPHELLDQLGQLAEDKGVTRNELIREAVDEKLHREAHMEPEPTPA